MNPHSSSSRACPASAHRGSRATARSRPRRSRLLALRLHIRLAVGGHALRRGPFVHCLHVCFPVDSGVDQEIAAVDRLRRHADERQIHETGRIGHAETLAVQVRGIALKQIDLKTAWRTLKRELGAGLINGLITGILVAIVVVLLNHDIRLALVLAAAMVINLLVAAFLGTLVPLVMEKLGKDPAASATIFITTATDVLGFLAFLGLATMILR